MRSCVPSLITALTALAMLVGPVGLEARPLPDPTRPPDFHALAPLHPAKAFHLTAILIAPHRRLATVNGLTVQVGTRVAGATVLAISPDSVRLRLPSGRLERLTLYPTHMRTAPRSL